MPRLAVPRCCTSAAMPECTPSEKRSLIYVYTGKGAGTRSALSAARALSLSLPLADVRTLSASALLEGSWSSPSSSSSPSPIAAAVALVMPGGADLPYCADLNGRGNEIIRLFVKEGGGSYLGLCAGGYYGSSRVEFELESEVLCVEGERELAFFPGVALGAAVPGFRYETEAGAAATRLLWRRSRTESGGKAGEEEEREDWNECLDYCNGGPVFVLRGEEGKDEKQRSCRRVPDEIEVAGVAVEVLARYEENSSSSPSPSSSSSPAVAAASEGGAAAVRCRVGRGVAVLCGTHPELRPTSEWLLPPLSASSFPSGEQDRGGGGEEEKKNKSSTGTATAAVLAAEENTKVSELVSVLDDPAASAERGAYWESLLDAAGLGGLRGG